MLWVFDARVDFAPGRIVCVHAGLFTSGSLEEQLVGLRNKNLAARELQVGGYGRFEAFSGRREVEEMHPELEGKAILVSGHHGTTYQRGDRLIVDTSGGKYGDHNPIEAVILPSRKLVSSTPNDASRDPERFQQYKRYNPEQVARGLVVVQDEQRRAANQGDAQAEVTRKDVEGVLIKFAVKDEATSSDEEDVWG